ncbi:unnamed protein product [Owenia fusiformis]|uniref:Solute carrier organic anion transporter family member n=1 Tax=Owenia fusiformis TaxID=6347 RepID=A0A8J1TZD2_OWEFU|nr:unnamed protein product [Owenia fusiformis]
MSVAKRENLTLPNISSHFDSPSIDLPSIHIENVNDENTTTAVTTATSQATTDTETEQEPERCGFYGKSPDWLQALARPKCFLACISAAVLTQSILVSGYTSSIITTIERRYNLWSSRSGLIVSSYEFTSIIAVVLVGHFGEHFNRSRWIGYGLLIMAFGGFVFTLPFFFGGTYNYVDQSNQTNLLNRNLCNNTLNRGGDCDIEVTSMDTWALATFMIAQMIIGLGASPLYTLGSTYLYDNCKKKLYSVYAGIMYAMASHGPALGFLLGAVFLSFYVDPQSNPGDLTESDPKWVGAWWGGTLFCSTLAAVSALPLLLFPRKLDVQDEDGAECEAPQMIGFGSSLKEIPGRTKRMFMNGTWLFISLCIVMEQSIIAGFVVFMAKYLQVTFWIQVSQANIITGSVIIPGACAGVVTGGYALKRLRLDLLGMIQLLGSISFVPVVSLIVLFFLGCNSIQLAGVTIPYEPLRTVQKVQEIVTYRENLTSNCNQLCECSDMYYQPVCGTDQKTYFSPCHAGCTSLRTYLNDEGSTVKNYSSCGCIYKDIIHKESIASSGRCDNGCYNLIPFLAILFIIIFITCCGQTPSLLITLRSVPENDRSLALGLQFFLLRGLAFIPAPIYFGKLFDSQCLLRENTCDGPGSCLEYNTDQLPYATFGMAVALKFLSISCVGLCYLCCRRKMNITKKLAVEQTDDVTVRTTPPFQSQSNDLTCSNIGVTPSESVCTDITALSTVASTPCDIHVDGNAIGDSCTDDDHLGNSAKY